LKPRQRFCDLCAVARRKTTFRRANQNRVISTTVTDFAPA
jgi:hypothetical protein